MMLLETIASKKTALPVAQKGWRYLFAESGETFSESTVKTYIWRAAGVYLQTRSATDGYSPRIPCALKER